MLFRSSNRKINRKIKPEKRFEMFKNLTWGPTSQCHPESFSSFFEIAGNRGRDGGAPATHRRRLPAARARGRDGEVWERLGEEVAQLVRALADYGEHGRHQGVFPGGWSYRSRTNSSIPATGYPGELGIGITVVWGCSGWRESARGRLRLGESSGGQCGEGELDSGDVLLLWLRVYGGGRVREWERRCGEREVRGWLLIAPPSSGRS